MWYCLMICLILVFKSRLKFSGNVDGKCYNIEKRVNRGK